MKLNSTLNVATYMETLVNLEKNSSKEYSWTFLLLLLLLFLEAPLLTD